MAQLKIYPRGFSLKSGLGGFPKTGGGRRGKCDGKFSSASFRRLREFVISNTATGDCWGLTLTVPGIDNLTHDEFKIIVHRLVAWLNSRKIALVWRVELQQRGMPHLHCVTFCDQKVCILIVCEWVKLLGHYTCFSSEKVGEQESEIVLMPRAYVRGSRHCVDVQRLDAGFSAFRYLVAHMSKGKQAQLGFRGRFWGVVCRRLWRKSESEEKSLLEIEYFVLLRWLRRLTRRKIYARSGCSYWVSNPDTVNKMLLYLRASSYLDERKPGGALARRLASGNRPIIKDENK